MLNQYLYISTAKEQLSKEDVDAILKSSKRNNAKNDLTGLLIYRPPHFVQLLEGPKAAVSNTMSKIKADERHQDLITLFDSAAPVRCFPDWKMGFIKSEEPLKSPEQKLRKILDVAFGQASNDEILKALALISGTDLDAKRQNSA